MIDSQRKESDKKKIKIVLKIKIKSIKKINKNNSLPSFKKSNKSYSSSSSSSSSKEKDSDKQDILSTKKLIDCTNSSFLPIKKSSSLGIISINKKLINDLNYQIKDTNLRIFGNDFAYKQSINLQEINDYVIYEETKNIIEKNKKKGKKNSLDFRMPLIYRRMANHCKREDLIPMKNKPKINLKDVLIMHNSIFRKSMSQNKCKNYYFKNNVKLLYNNLKNKDIYIKKY